MHSSPYIQNNENISRMMLAVIYALIPGTLAYVHFFGFGVLINIIIAVATAIVCELTVLKIRNTQ